MSKRASGTSSSARHSLNGGSSPEGRPVAGANGKSHVSSSQQFRVVLTSPSRISVLGRKGETAFAAGVQQALRSASRNQIAVAVRTQDGAVVHEIPVRRAKGFALPKAELVKVSGRKIAPTLKAVSAKRPPRF